MTYKTWAKWGGSIRVVEEWEIRILWTCVYWVLGYLYKKAIANNIGYFIKNDNHKSATINYIGIAQLNAKRNRKIQKWRADSRMTYLSTNNIEPHLHKINGPMISNIIIMVRVSNSMFVILYMKRQGSSYRCTYNLNTMYTLNSWLISLYI